MLRKGGKTKRGAPTDTHVFLVYVDVEEKVVSEAQHIVKFTRSVREAHSAPIADVHAMYDDIFAITQASVSLGESGYEALERALAHRPGLLRMMVVDDSLDSDIRRTPFFSMHPVELSDDPNVMSYAESEMLSDADWLSRLRKVITIGDGSWKVTARQKVFSGWYAKHERACIYAMIHAMNLQSHPDRASEFAFSN